MGSPFEDGHITWARSYIRFGRRLLKTAALASDVVPGGSISLGEYGVQWIFLRWGSRADLAILGLRGASVKYKIALQKTAEGYAVSVPGLPGCWSQGATESEALGNIRDAIREYLAARKDLLKGTVVREVDVAS